MHEGVLLPPMPAQLARARHCPPRGRPAGARRLRDASRRCTDAGSSGRRHARGKKGTTIDHWRLPTLHKFRS
ncbi:hypothetical protein PXO_01696 [Xanthomonas oryzae pv. oryzae PXO99A]|uniref:Uncharacterized protein n=1 Tax=Xanthomonas oryzae pv. oryzae (strain PXO99A) TaxID=360094 RepID=A0A0K0GLR6_XANOP|nr:hypothetical protein PXO_01696 [Xanthomonas oryzae pv. oryzae PXO99A]